MFAGSPPPPSEAFADKFLGECYYGSCDPPDVLGRLSAIAQVWRMVGGGGFALSGAGGGASWINRGRTAASTTQKATALPRLVTTATQLQKKFEHASALGISGNYSPPNAQLLAKALASHIDDAARYQGTYRGHAAIHNLSVATRVSVVQHANGQFWTVARLSPEQFINVVTRRSL